MEKLTYTHNDAAAKVLAAFYETPPLAYVRSYGCQQNVNDGEKIKVARGVNSFVTTMQGKGEDFKKIKLVDIMDMIHDDIKKTGHDSYIGKYANSYDNRCLLITAIQGYLDTLETEGLLERNQNTVSIDIQAVKNWRESNGLNTKAELAVMKDQTIKELNIHDNVFLAMDLSILDAIVAPHAGSVD